MQWNNTFIPRNEALTMVHVVMTFETEADIEETIKMGIKEGFTMALSNLDALILHLTTT